MNCISERTLIWNGYPIVRAPVTLIFDTIDPVNPIIHMMIVSVLNLSVCAYEEFRLFFHCSIENAPDSVRIGVAWGYTGAGSFIFVM